MEIRAGNNADKGHHRDFRIISLEAQPKQFNRQRGYAAGC